MKPPLLNRDSISLNDSNNILLSSFAVLKEEPDDLIHLAPTPGDACISLEESTPFLSTYDEFNDLIDNYFLRDDISSLDSAVVASNQVALGQQEQPQQAAANLNTGVILSSPNESGLLLNRTIFGEDFASNPNAILSVNNNNNDSNHSSVGSINIDLVGGSGAGCGNNSASTDPFINYRDESSDTSGTPHLLSPGGVSSKVIIPTAVPTLVNFSIEIYSRRKLVCA